MNLPNCANDFLKMNDYQVYNIFRRKRLRDHQDVDEEFYAPYDGERTMMTRINVSLLF